MFRLILRHDNPSSWSRSSSWLPVALLFLVGAAGGVATAADVGTLVAPLQAARERGSFGSVGGRAYEEGKRGGADATPYPMVSVLLLPRSPEFESKLEAIKAGSRESIDAYVEAEPKIERGAARLRAGADRIGSGPADPGRGFVRRRRLPFPEGPRGRLDAPGVARDAAREEARRHEEERDAALPITRRRSSVTRRSWFWSMPVVVKAGEEVTVRLHDRNEWLTGIREDRRVPDENQRTLPQTQQGAAPR